MAKFVSQENLRRFRQAYDERLAGVAFSGAASDVTYSNTIGGTAVTNVDDAIDALVTASGDGVASKTVYLKDDETVTSGYLKTYGIYQGATLAGATLVGKIDIPKDLVVTSGQVVVDPAGQPAGTYIQLTIANQVEPIYINVADLCDVYTAAQSAAQVQLAISATNEISATIVAGSIGTTELADDAVTTAKIADDAVTADKVAIAAHTESNTLGTDGVSVSVSTTNGQVSAVSASIAAETYDDYGAAATAKSEVIGASTDASTADTVYGAKAYADAQVATIVALTDAEVDAVFTNPTP